MEAKYNYDKAMKLFVDSYISGHKPTYKEVEEALGLSSPIEDKTTSKNVCALYELRSRLRKKYDLEFKSAAGGKYSGPEYQYYNITEVSESKSSMQQKDSSKKKVKVAGPNLDALSRDNQKLYQEVEELRLQNRRLLDMVSEANSNIEGYKTIIKSLMVLAGIDL